MAELQPVDSNSQQPNGGVLPPASTSAEAPSIPAAGSKRLRRPSVRLGEIGGDHQKWSGNNNNNRKDKSSRTRTLTNLGCGYDEDREGNVDSFSWRVKKRVGSTTAAKRVRSNWVSKSGDPHGNEELEAGFRDFSREDSESPIKEESYGRRRNESNNSSGNMEGVGGGEGVKIWLQELGLGRYWPMFEIHEVDEEVLPLLTLEDLKDMGINAVGSRRKMFSAIHKLAREFS